MSAEMDPKLFGAGDLTVRIMDLSGANGSDPVEEVRGFLTIEHANAFARRYVRDSVERCRAPGLDAKAVLDAWFAFGEDAEVVGAAENGWVSGSELKGFAETPVRDSEERNWRMLDPRRDEESEDAA
jgi:hypothetical protein